MCVKTLSAICYGSKENGKKLIKILPKKQRLDASSFSHITKGGVEFIQIPCGQCIECRLNKSREWASRCMHEASLSEHNCFITLTFNDEYLDPIASVRLETFQKFLKRLRRAVAPVKVRFFHAAEYGDKFGRPHHHAILFGFDFPDKVLVRRTSSFCYYNSALLEKLWSDPINGKSFGYHEISDVTWESCAYVARYVVKKINGKGTTKDGRFISAEDHYTVFDEQGNAHSRKPEFCTMSRRPGIGLGWYEKYKHTDVWAHDRIHIRGNAYQKPPRYYGSKYEIECPDDYAKIKLKRIELAKQRDDNSPERQRSREICKQAQVSMLKRNLNE